MENLTPVVLHVVGTDTVARSKVLYCEEVANAFLLLGKRFKCESLQLEVTLNSVSTSGTAALTAFAFSGDTLPSDQRLEFREVSE